GAIVLARPERAAGMDEQDFEASGSPPVKEQSRGNLRHQSDSGRTVTTSRVPAGRGRNNSSSGLVRKSQCAQSSGLSTATCRSWYGATSGPGEIGRAHV